MNELHLIEQAVDQLAAIIDAPPSLLPTFGRSADGARPHIETDLNDLWHYVIVERGEELERKTTEHGDELLYWIFDSVTFSMAASYELKNRISNQDPRRQLFQHQETLLGQLHEGWQERKVGEHRGILKRNPFRD